MLACGVDLVRVDRIEATLARFGPRFLKRVFTAGEQALCGGRATCLAGRWAAKEATSKALGCGIGEVAWTEIEVLRDERGAPVLQLHGAAAHRATALALTWWAISLSHDDGRAIALVVASRTP